MTAEAIWLAYETKSVLVGESANPELVEKIRGIVTQYDAVESVNELLTTDMEPNFVLATLNVNFKDALNTGELEQTIANIDLQIRQSCPSVKRVFIEAEAWSSLTAKHQ